MSQFDRLELHGVELQSVVSQSETPCFIYSEAVLHATLRRVNRATEQARCRLLFAIKAFSISDGLEIVSAYVDGFSVSSPFEAVLARSVLNGTGQIHYTSPGMRQEEFSEIRDLSDYLTFNSLSQWGRFTESIPDNSNCGIRVNPQLSLVHKTPYDPCRPHSKLGVPLNALTALDFSSPKLKGLSGLHFHSNCESSDFSGLLATVKTLDSNLREFLKTLQWVNLGGGYLFEDEANIEPLREAVELLRSNYGLDVFVEPGAALVRDAGFLVTTVLDVFDSDGKSVAILDTTINHAPEVFEYQYSPEVVGAVDDGDHTYILAGCSCLAGDLFGEYGFGEPLEVGSRVIFAGMGDYTTVKWHMFNGINLPTIYALTESDELILKRRFTYEDFQSRCGVSAYASI